MLSALPERRCGRSDENCSKNMSTNTEAEPCYVLQCNTFLYQDMRTRCYDVVPGKTYSPPPTMLSVPLSYDSTSLRSHSPDVLPYCVAVTTHMGKVPMHE